MKNPESYELPHREKKNMNNGTHVAGPTGDEPAELRKRLAKAERNLAPLQADLDAARASGECFRQILESVSDVIFEIDSQGRVLYLSPMIKAIWGYDAGSGSDRGNGTGPAQYLHQRLTGHAGWRRHFSGDRKRLPRPRHRGLP